MARKGRDFELLIEKLEKIALPENAKIESPGFLMDRVTGQKREVDILIRSKIGTSEVYIVIECRKRKSVQDTTWIEQIHTKMGDIHVNKVIAVSKSPFTKPALEKARFYSIEARTLDEIDFDVIKSWWHVEHIDVLSNHFTIVSATIIFDDELDLGEFLQGNNAETKFIYSTTTNIAYSLNQQFQLVTSQIKEWAEMDPNGEPINRSIIVEYTNPDDRCYIIFEGRKLLIKRIHYVVHLRVIAKKIPISSIGQYSGTDGALSHVIEYKGVPIGDNNVFQLIKNSDGSLSLSVRKEE